jgi:DNA-binding PadR family transcriptional regulator
MPKPIPTHTSYAVLGLLAVRSWTTYELARQSERSLRWFFPRAERAVYLEAKRLVELGWATAESTTTGKRPSTVYTITDDGRRALTAWLARPSSPFQLESEAALKVFFADQSGFDDLRSTVEGMRLDARSAVDRLADMAAARLVGDAPFPERVKTTMLSMRLISDLHRTIHDWTDWVAGEIDTLESGDEEAIAEHSMATANRIHRAAVDLP